jgi:hypothetical protein
MNFQVQLKFKSGYFSDGQLLEPSISVRENHDSKLIAPHLFEFDL